MSDNPRQIENAILVTLPPNTILAEAELRIRVEQFRQIFPIDDAARDALLRRLHAKLAIRMDVGVALVDIGHTPWLLARRSQIDPFYWERYSKYLASFGWPASVVTTIDKVTDDVLDLCGDPLHEHRLQRRGLVVGDVQSGKTSTYTALSCKAADAGYRLIILLTGTLESLRRQTQERLDAGFIGLDSSGFLSERRQRREVGVGLIDHSRTGVVFTSRIKDFSTALVNQLNFRLDAFHEPILLVVKKNKRILENLYNWLHDYNAGPDELVGSPLLLIDDEADNASVNTRSGDEDPTEINGRIRSLLSLFHRASYVGFTATPFANIFIDPDSETAMLGDDLFPRDYIYALEPPTNYVGPAALFGDEPRLEAVSTIEDAEPYFPQGHKSDLQVTELPTSLLRAIDDFVMANAVRDLRGEGSTHRSMLVNVSHLTNVQMQVSGLIERHVRQMQGDVRNYSRLSEVEARRNPTIGRLQGVWETRFRDAWPDWGEVQVALKDALLPVTVRAVNQRTGAAALDYAVQRENGLRVIAVGGNSLSRGLTLEGLSTSYFHRNSQMYDTLLQMGRWFGYRDGYEDVCRLWLSGPAQHWYRHITRATLELRSEIWRMQRLGLTPKDFGLKVRAHPDSLIVTARNKMRAAKTIERVVSFSKQALETPRVLSDESPLAANAFVIRDFIGTIERAGVKRGVSLVAAGNPLWVGVPKERVSDLLRRFRTDPRNFAFSGTELADFLDRTDEACLSEWDVVIPFGEGRAFPMLNDLAVHLQKRVVSVGPGPTVLVSGKSARVGSRGIEREGMSSSQVDMAEAAYKEANPEKRSVPDWAYRDYRSRPLLLIHCIEAHDEKGNRVAPKTECFIALGLSFPKFADTAQEERVLYRINVVELRTMFEDELDDDEEDTRVS